VLKNYRSVSLQ